MPNNFKQTISNSALARKALPDMEELKRILSKNDE